MQENFILDENQVDRLVQLVKHELSGLRIRQFFKRQVLCLDAFDIKSFVLNIKAIFGEKIIYSNNHLKLCV